MYRATLDGTIVHANQALARMLGYTGVDELMTLDLNHGVYLDPREYWLPIHRDDGSLIARADGQVDKAVHVKTMQGDRSALKRIEFVLPGCYLEFTMKVLGASAQGSELGNSVKPEDFEYLFMYGGTHGYAGERGDGEGRYDYTIECLNPPKRGTATANVGRDRGEVRADSGRTRTTDHQRQSGRADESNVEGHHECSESGDAVLDLARKVRA